MENGQAHRPFPQRTILKILLREPALILPLFVVYASVKFFRNSLDRKETNHNLRVMHTNTVARHKRAAEHSRQSVGLLVAAPKIGLGALMFETSLDKVAD